MNCRQAAVVSGVHRLQHVERLSAADLAHDDPIGPHAERVDDQIAGGDPAPTFDVRRPRLHADDVLLIENQLGRVFDGDDAFGRRNGFRQAPRNVDLPAPVPPEISTFLRSRTA